MKIDSIALRKAALIARSKSYSPYSNFAVGAALLLKNGDYVYGANIENAAYPLCMCAERNSLYNAMMDGYKADDFVALGLIADSDKIVSPCGACRQVLSELFPADAPIYLWILDSDEPVITTIRELLPLAFDKDNL